MRVVCIASASRAAWTASDDVGTQKKRRKTALISLPLLRRPSRKRCMEYEQILQTKERGERNAFALSIATVGAHFDDVRASRHRRRGEHVKAFATTSMTTEDGGKNDAQKIATTTTKKKIDINRTNHESSRSCVLTLARCRSICRVWRENIFW